MSTNYKKSSKPNRTRLHRNVVQQNYNQLTQRVQHNRSDSLAVDNTAAQNTELDPATCSIHKMWPDLQLNQSSLFFECTLFLYSILALFLQYLNLYRTFWWLPKSHWHYSMKYHLMNPYVLSCIGLLLGVRVTKCFWDVISERIDSLCEKTEDGSDKEGCQTIFWRVIESAIVKIPLSAVVGTSFVFSFTRIYKEFGIKAFILYYTPFVVYVSLFRRTIVTWLFERIPQWWLLNSAKSACLQPNKIVSEQQPISPVCESNSSGLIDIKSFAHVCSESSVKTQNEATVLLRDFELRCQYCIYTGLLTAYFSVFMPRIFVPVRAMTGDSQFMLIDDVWTVQLFCIVALTGCSLYVTYLFPINYFDSLYRCAVHLGHWERVESATPIQQQLGQPRIGRAAQNEQLNEGCELFEERNDVPCPDGTRLLHNGEVYIARSHPHHSSVCAEPGNAAHQQLYRIGKEPVALASYLCLFQAALVAFEFWLLLLTSDWQQIVTLVLLMFANYLLLGKMFKDRVIIGRIYSPSEEDLQLIKQLQEENKRIQQQVAKKQSAQM